MKVIYKMGNKISGLYSAMFRYPLTVFFLVIAAIVNAKGINQGESYNKLVLTFIVGAFIGCISQSAFERFFEKFLNRIILMVISALLTFGYFSIVNRYSATNTETLIRSSALLFALIIAYIWIPVIKSPISFNESFMCAFKAFFNSLLFSVILLSGISLIISAIYLLLFNINEKSYIHILNIISVIFGPIYFLSLIPIYPGALKNELAEDNPLNPKEIIEYDEDSIIKASSCPRFLEILISYIIIPLISVYTLILLIYIARNIKDNFRSDSLLEPLLIGFSITVILVYILTSSIDNNFVKFFRKIFPKILIPIVMFQINSSIMKIKDTGITYECYYTILFGIFAALSGIFLSFIPIRKNSIIAKLLIVFSLFSIIPPVDAFTISRINQEKMLKNVLLKNNMLVDNKISPNSSISEADKKIISSTLSYLEMMEYTKTIDYLEKDFYLYTDFYNTFGFNRYDDMIYNKDSFHMSLNQQSPIMISGYDTLVSSSFNLEKDNKDSNNKLCDFKKAGKTYTLATRIANNSGKLLLFNDKNQNLIEIDFKNVFDGFNTSLSGENYQVSKNLVSADEATFTLENKSAVISLVALNLNIEKSNSESQYSGDFYIFVKIK